MTKAEDATSEARIRVRKMLENDIVNSRFLIPSQPSRRVFAAPRSLVRRQHRASGVRQTLMRRPGLDKIGGAMTAASVKTNSRKALAAGESRLPRR
jgi:hypothetical protein